MERNSNMIKKSIIKKYEKFWLNSNKNNYNSYSRSNSIDSSKEFNTTSLLYSIFIDSNASSLCESLLCDEDRRIMNDINIDDIMEMILNNTNNNNINNNNYRSETNHTNDEDNVYERLKIAYNDGKLILFSSYYLSIHICLYIQS